MTRCKTCDSPLVWGRTRDDAAPTYLSLTPSEALWVPHVCPVPDAVAPDERWWKATCRAGRKPKAAAVRPPVDTSTSPLPKWWLLESKQPPPFQPWQSVSLEL